MPDLVTIAPIDDGEDRPPALELSDDLSEFGSGRSLDEIVRLGREVILDPTYSTARAWKRSGRGKAVGCFPVYTPQELVHSLGMLPISLHGGGESIEISHADAALGSFLCSISKSTLELALVGHLAPFDALVFPYVCDVSRNLEGIGARLLPGTATYMLHLPQNFRSAATAPFLLSEYRRLIDRLVAAGGERYDPARLTGSIALFERQRRRMAELDAIRRRTPGKISLVDAYVLKRLGGLLPREVHVALLDRAIPEIAARPDRPRDSVRVVVVGPFCEQPTLDLLDLVEQVGCSVVGEELLPIHQWYGDLPPGDDPLVRLASAYVTSPVDLGVRATPTTKGEAILDRVRKADAGAVLFLTAKFCEPALEDVVLYRRALDREKVPYLHLEFEERSTSYEQSRLQLETFVESILLD